MRAQKTANATVAAGAALFALALWASHWFFLENIHHRIGGIAWNSLFQIFGNFFAMLVAIWLLAATYSGRVNRIVGLAAALALGLTGGCCLFRSLGMMMSI